PPEFLAHPLQGVAVRHPGEDLADPGRLLLDNGEAAALALNRGRRVGNPVGLWPPMLALGYLVGLAATHPIGDAFSFVFGDAGDHRGHQAALSAVLGAARDILQLYPGRAE